MIPRVLAISSQSLPYSYRVEESNSSSLWASWYLKSPQRELKSVGRFGTCLVSSLDFSFSIGTLSTSRMFMIALINSNYWKKVITARSPYLSLLDPLKTVFNDLSHLRQVSVVESQVWEVSWRCSSKFLITELGYGCGMSIWECSGVLTLEKVDDLCQIHIDCLWNNDGSLFLLINLLL